MPTLSRTYLAALAALLLLQPVAKAASPLTLYYTDAATKWTEALPIGNGRLGAMVFGGVTREHLQLNESTLWAGGPYDPNNTNALGALPEARRLIFAGKYDDAAKLVSDKMMATPVREMPYETLGDLYLDFPVNLPVNDYRRDLDLDTAVATVTYTAEGVRFKREIFSSAADQVIVVRLTADQPGKISFTATTQTPQQATNTMAGTNTLILRGKNGEAHGIKGALRFEARITALAENGQYTSSTNQIAVKNADAVTLIIAAATSYKNYHDVSGDPITIAKGQVAAASQKKYDALRAAHVAAYQKLFHRVQLTLDTDEALNLPTDQRIKNFSNGNDPQLAAVYFQFARYLLISCSQPGGQPATLQGLWNDSMTPPWDSKYTININTEMNYWPAETCNLSECVEPLTQMVLEMAETGQRTAKIHYGARGWVAHHNTDLWRATAPVDGPNSGMWPMGGAWLLQNLWEHYLFTGDNKYLEKIYPAMKGAAQFYLDTLVEERTHHWLITCPSLSPENKNPASEKTSLCAGPTMDEEILRDLFANYITAANALGKDKKFATEVAVARSRLAPLLIGGSGQLQEWLTDVDLLSHDLHHRHVSHLYGLYPSAQIDVNGTPEYAAAVKKSLEIRGDQATGWATAWRINLWARLHDGDHAFSIFEFLLSPARTFPDMFDAHPPFQIDGNFGGAAGIAEMLLQSQNDEIQILPALPGAWANGSVTGLRARGGFEVGITWKEGQIVNVTLHSLNGNPVRLRYGGTTKFVGTKKGETFTWDGK
ncbi:MAG TPA: glycoside hydrolase family 95 protein [Verrucomicrobiae bacterium]|nr:glycoside hydrolase family 95 protein [Verrucomicrobiae bacterium]